MDRCKITKVQTSYGKIACYTQGGGSPALLCLHSNSLDSRIFKHIFSSSIPSHTQVIALDYPGHGQSDDATDPEKTYTQPAYARCAVEVLQHLGIEQVLVLGSSLGGHVGLEMIPLLSTIRGVMIVGSPPVPLGQPSKGFNFDDWTKMPSARDDLSPEEMLAFAKGTSGAYDEWMHGALQRTDQRARRIMFAGFAAGETLDQQKLVETSDVPVAVVNGKDDPFMRHEFIKSVKYKNLWRGQCFELEGLKHMPHLEGPDEFLPILEAFIKDLP